jgi:hypothetical protein
MKVLNPAHYRRRGDVAGTVTPKNVDEVLDAGELEVKMSHGKWWRVRRNGQTKTWKRSDRFRIPTKAGMWAYGAITQDDFVEVDQGGQCENDPG